VASGILRAFYLWLAVVGQKDLQSILKVVYAAALSFMFA
jgi:hypothetical protein